MYKTVQYIRIFSETFLCCWRMLEDGPQLCFQELPIFKENIYEIASCVKGMKINLKNSLYVKRNL
jgi:hypothetical protein